jgi:hypothetical protein
MRDKWIDIKDYNVLSPEVTRLDLDWAHRKSTDYDIGKSPVLANGEWLVVNGRGKNPLYSAQYILKAHAVW